MSVPEFAGPGSPWYRHFWPWFIVGLLSITVVAGLTTVWIAVVNRDSLVSDDWYEDGKSINRRFAREELAQELRIGARFAIASDTGEVVLDLTGVGVEDVTFATLSLSHPTLSRLDQRVPLVRGTDGRYRGRVPEPVEGRWYARLEPGVEGPGGMWRLQEVIVITLGDSIALGSDR